MARRMLSAVSAGELTSDQFGTPRILKPGRALQLKGTLVFLRRLGVIDLVAPTSIRAPRILGV